MVGDRQNGIHVMARNIKYIHISRNSLTCENISFFPSSTRTLDLDFDPIKWKENVSISFISKIVFF
jgi:hypothetical protein